MAKITAKDVADSKTIFAKIAEIEKQHRWLKNKHIIGVADPSIWDASRGEAIIEAAVRNGVYFTKGDNKRLPGWMQVHYRLQFDENGYTDDVCFQHLQGVYKDCSGAFVQFNQSRGFRHDGRGPYC